MIEIKNKYNTLLLYKKYPTILKKKILFSLLKKKFKKRLYKEFIKSNHDIKKIPNINLIYFDEFLVTKEEYLKLKKQIYIIIKIYLNYFNKLVLKND